MEAISNPYRGHGLPPHPELAEGRVIRPGRRLVVVQSDVFAITGDTRRHVALLTGTMVPVSA